MDKQCFVFWWSTWIYRIKYALYYHNIGVIPLLMHRKYVYLEPPNQIQPSGAMPEYS